MTSITIGDVVKSLDAVNTVVTGIAFAIVPNPDGGPVTVNWTFEKGTNPATAVQVDLEGSVDNILYVQRDTYATPGTSVNRVVSIGKDKFVRVRVVSLTIGTGDPFTCQISR